MKIVDWELLWSTEVLESMKSQAPNHEVSGVGCQVSGKRKEKAATRTVIIKTEH